MRPVETRVPDLLTTPVMTVLASTFWAAFATNASERFLGLYFRERLGFSPVEVGILIGLTPLTAMLFGIVGGHLAEQLGLARAYTLSLGISGLCMVGFATFHQYLVLCLFCAFLGISTSTLRNGGQALLNIHTRGPVSGLAQNYMYWLKNVALVVAPPAAALLLHAGFRATPFMVAAGILLGLALAVWRVGHRSGFMPRGTSADVRTPRSLSSTFHAVVKNRSLRWAFVGWFALILVESQIASTTPLYLAQKFTDGVQIYGVLSGGNALIVVVLTPLATLLLAKSKTYLPIPIGLVLLGGGLFIAGWSSHLVGWLVGFGLYGLGEALSAPKLNDLTAEIAKADSGAMYFAAMNTAIYMALFIGYTFGAAMYERLPSGILYSIMLGLSFVSGASFLFSRILLANGHS